ncbi:unnamed protein product [Brassica oleracea]
MRTTWPVAVAVSMKAAVASGGVDEGGGSAVRLRGDESGDINFLWGVGKEDIRLSKMQTTWKHEYMTNLCLALVVESDGSREYSIPSSYLCIVVAVYNKVSFTKHTFTGLEEDNERCANIS